MKVAIKRAEPDQLFDFLHEVKLDISLKEYLGKLLGVDLVKTIEYLMVKYA